ncbi:pentapeptide repeat-containing protein, partial [Acidobacteriota bacterium]
MPDKKKVTCKYTRVDYKCDRILFDDEHCIFHSTDIEGKRDKFTVAFWKEFERQKRDEEEYYFKGFVFPGKISFEKVEFEKYAILFIESKFHGKADFGGARFFGYADFRGSQFFHQANFNVTH